MGPVAIGLFYIGEALVYSTIWFSLISCFFRSPVRRKSTWGWGFLLITIILAMINAFIAHTIAENMNDDQLSTLYGFQAFVIPILVSVVYWIVIKIFFSKNRK